MMIIKIIITKIDNKSKHAYEQHIELHKSLHLTYHKTK